MCCAWCGYPGAAPGAWCGYPGAAPGAWCGYPGAAVVNLANLVINNKKNAIYDTFLFMNACIYQKKVVPL